MNLKFKKVISLFLFIFVFSNTLFFIKPQKTEAFDVVLDPSNLIQNIISAGATIASKVIDKSMWTKEFIWDGLAYQIARIAVQQMVSSTIDWINSGFQGNPAYITDLDGYLESIGDVVVGEYIYGSKLNFLCSPFALDVKNALMVQYYRGKTYEPRCTLSEVTNNIDGAFDGLSNEWDWDVWNSITQTTTNNPFGSFIDTSVNLNTDIRNKRNQEQIKIGWGDGFLSWEECIEELAGDPTTVECSIKTPGSVLAGITNDSITIGGKALIQADEINEIVGALLSQLVQQVAGPDGLSGSSKGSGGQASYTSSLSSNQGDVSGLIKNSIDSINEDLKTENSYLTPKQNSLNAAKESRLKLEELSNCYIEKGQIAYENTPSQKLWKSGGDYITPTIANNRSNNATSTISLIPQPIINRIDPQVFSSQNIIETLNNTKTDVQTAQNVFSLNSILNDYQIILEKNLLHTIEDIANAQVEKEGIIDQMNTLNQTTEEQITECKSYILKSDPNNN